MIGTTFGVPPVDGLDVCSFTDISVEAAVEDKPYALQPPPHPTPHTLYSHPNPYTLNPEPYNLIPES